MDIAIIGTAFELQDTDSIQQLWENIAYGKVITKYDSSDMSQNEFKLNNFNLYKIKKFSPKFFNYTPEQSKKMDPQHRRLLMLTYKMLEAYDKDNKTLSSTLDKNVGVYTSVGTSNYLMNNLLNSGIDIDYTTYINNVPETSASKISYNFDFHGPSLNFLSACSSASLALYYAVNDLTTKKISTAIVGSSHLPVENSLTYRYKSDSIFSKTGLCSPFDINSNGMIPGFGSIIFALKRKEDAIKDNNNILAIIKGIGVSNDGKDKASYTAPGIIGQSQAIENAYFNSGVNMADIDYLETHGTGTAIGDAIETTTIAKTFNKVKKDKLKVGSIKANYGHLDTASSFLSILKAILMLNNQKIPIQANYVSKNPLLTNENILISKELKSAELNYIGINSFGIGGTNAHIILQKNDIESPLYDLELNDKKLIEETYWIDDKEQSKTENNSKKENLSEEQLLNYISNYLGYDKFEFRKMTIGELNLESYVLIDLLDELANEFGLHFDLSDFQELNSNLMDIILSKIPKNTKNDESLLHILGEFNDSQKTLFLIHPAGGTINGYNNFFNHLSVHYNIVLLSFPFEGIEYLKFFSLKQLAHLYKEKILAFVESRNTDFIIGGYSFGGNVAFEIARQLQEDSFVKLPEIIMIDSHPIEAYNHIGKKQITDEGMDLAIEEFVKQGIIGRDIQGNSINKYSSVWKINHDMLKNYDIPEIKLNSKLHILICKEEENLDLLNELGIQYLDKTIWQKRFKSSINYKFIDGNHYSIYSNSVLSTKVGKEITAIMEDKE